MQIAIPLTGTVLVEGSVHGAGDLRGADDDPIRPIALPLGRVSWQMVDVDLEDGVMIIDVTPDAEVYERPDPNGPTIRRPTTPAEQAEALQRVQNLVLNHTRDELYSMARQPRLKRPFRGALS